MEQITLWCQSLFLRILPPGNTASPLCVLVRILHGNIMGNSLTYHSLVTSDPHFCSPCTLYWPTSPSLTWEFLLSFPIDLWHFFRKHKVISFSGCIAQIFFIHVMVGVEMVLLIAMAFDDTLPYVSLSTIWPSWAQECVFSFSGCLDSWPYSLHGSTGFCCKLTLLAKPHPPAGQLCLTFLSSSNLPA